MGVTWLKALHFADPEEAREKIVAAAIEHRGRLNRTAAALGCSVKSLRRIIADDPALRVRLDRVWTKARRTTLAPIPGHVVREPEQQKLTSLKARHIADPERARDEIVAAAVEHFAMQGKMAEALGCSLPTLKRLLLHDLELRKLVGAVRAALRRAGAR